MIKLGDLYEYKAIYDMLHEVYSHYWLVVEIAVNGRITFRNLLNNGVRCLFDSPVYYGFTLVE